MYNVKVTATGRRYCFVVHGYNVVLDIIGGPETVGMHPLDILQYDMEQMVEVLKRFERFTATTPKEIIIPQIQKDGVVRVTLEDVIGKKPDDLNNGHD